MSATLLAALIVLGAVLIFVAMLVSVWLQNRREDQPGAPGIPTFQASPSTFNPDQATAEDMEQLSSLIKNLLASGMKIQAIQAYREVTGSSLKEAKAAVEAIERGEPVLPHPPKRAVAPGDMQAQVRELLQRGNKIEAIKIYIEATGAGLREAKDAVDAIEQESR